MFRKKSAGKDLSGRERQIMDIIYRRGEAAVAEVMEELPDSRSYSTVRTLIGVLVRKGHLSHKEKNGRYIYFPTVSQQKARASALRKLVATFFNDSVDETVLALLELKGRKEDPEILLRLKQLIEKARRERTA